MRICADDYGLSVGICASIEALLAAGRIDATSAMVGGTAFRERADRLKALGKGEIGLHFDLTELPLLGEMPTAAPSGKPIPLHVLIPQALRRRLPLAEVSKELERQIVAFRDVMGRPPAYIDGHRHIHTLPIIRDAVLAAAADLGVWVRDPTDRPGRIAARPFADKAFLLNLLSYGFTRKARRFGVRTNDGFSGFSDFSAKRDVHAELRAATRSLGPEHLMMVHPGHASPDLPHDFSARRQAEHDALMAGIR